VYFTGSLGGRPVAFFSRHARGHRYAPHEINYRANICGFKMLGCDALLSASAVGSLKEQYAPRHAVIPDQFIDRTRHREDTFFGGGIVAHASFADPVCVALSDALEASAREAGVPVHRGGTYVCMEGPQFSTRAESNLYRSWGADVIGMTNLTEARLAREAEMCYASLALVTDYDCWRGAGGGGAGGGVPAALGGNGAPARRTRRGAGGGGGARGGRAPPAPPLSLPALHALRDPDGPEGDPSRGARTPAPDRGEVSLSRKRIVVTGSVAFDYLMTFPGRFVEHLVPDRLSRLSVSFLVDEMRRVPGGCAANIAYGLSL